MLKPSMNHKNRKSHNWLLYDIADRYLIEYIPFYKGVMLDLGCADKPYEDFFKQFVDSYQGVDWENTVHDNKADIIADLNSKLAIQDNYADTIVSLNVLEHLYEPQLFLKETYRILKQDGSLILHVPFQWWIHEAPHDYFRYTPYGLRYLLNSAGFSDIHIQPASGFFTTILLKINYFTLRAIRGSTFRKKLIQVLLKPIWWINQKIAIKLDAKHRGWSLEAQSFFVVAQKKEKIIKDLDRMVIASLTSYGRRINNVHLAIETILNQTKKADKLLLWLAEEEFNLDTIPENLKYLYKNNLIEIKFCKDIKSYKKLIPTIKLYPDDIIITFDDDVLYNADLIEKLYEEYLKSPETIHCARGHRILFDSENNILPYVKWNRLSENFLENFDVFPTGSGGVLYPPNCFYKDIYDETLFLQLAPNADDVWFKAMTLMNNRKSKILPQNNREYSALSLIDGTQEDALYHRNVYSGLNDTYIKNIFSHYSLKEKFRRYTQ